MSNLDGKSRRTVAGIAAALALAVVAGPAQATGGPPTYAVYAPPSGLGTGAGEPSIGVDERTGAVMYIAGLQMLKASFNDAASPAMATWQDVSTTLTSLTTFDPILYTDQKLGRTFVSQLLPTTVSLMAYTDDDGATWNVSQGAGIASGVDHQTVGGGPFHRGGLLGSLPQLYPHAIYYCSQDIALASCAVSLTGGSTFGPAVPIYNLTQCSGLHGHVKVAPDGTAYVPNKNCNGQAGVAVSTDNGVTWTVRTVPGSTAGSSDPSVGIGADGTLYLGWSNGDGHAYVAVSSSQGAAWSNITDVGASLGIQNIAFPAVVAGDGDRAAYAFLGTTAGGNATGDDPNFPAVWHLYVAHTFSRGASWTTVDVTPGDPVQRGTICTAGTTCGTTRNLLDFLGIAADGEGRVLVGYADGCVGACVGGGANTFAAEARIARQTGGQRLYAVFDP
ncbi:MAG TPA: sialidase family protein [Thermoanaerobaculia bacterium]|jgi:hypothetical protein|nr:sialidase family protein [Thermoanaerobaculia bacterium]